MALDYYKMGSLYLKLTSPMLERVIGAVMSLSQDIINEATTTENHANRLAWANQNKSGTPEYIIAMAEKMHRMAIVGNASYLANFDALLDGQIKNILSGFIDSVATGA